MTQTDRDDIALLIPWYETGALSPEERERVAAYLDAYSTEQRQLALAGEERAAAWTANEAWGRASPEALERVMAAISEPALPAEQARASTVKAMSGTWRAVQAVMSDLRTLFEAPMAQWAGAAAAILIVAQAATIGVLMNRDPGPDTRSDTYGTASGEQPTAVSTGPLLLIIFQNDATVGDVTGLMLEMGLEVIAGPLPGGVYRVRLADESRGAPGLHKVITQLKDKSAVVKTVVPFSR